MGEYDRLVRVGALEYVVKCSSAEEAALVEKECTDEDFYCRQATDIEDGDLDHVDFFDWNPA